MKRWENMVRELPLGNLEGMLNLMGEKGWELASVLLTDKTPFREKVTVFFRREKCVEVEMSVK